MGNKKRLWWCVVAIVIIVIVIVGLFIWGNRRANIPPGKNGTAVRPVPPVPIFTSHGSLAQGFPQELILDPSSTVLNSYTMSYASTTNQYAAEWNTADAMQSAFAQYEHYFTANGWTIINSSTKMLGIRALAAQNASGTANIVITQTGNGARIAASYIKTR